MESLNGNLPAIIWFVVGLVLILIEFGLPGFIIIFFGVGAWVVSAAAYFGLAASLQAQMLLFGISSVVLLVSLRRWAKGKFYGHLSSEQQPEAVLDEFTGKDVLVLKDVIPGEPGGQVELKGANWKAVAESPIKAGEMATVIQLDGLTLKIKKKEN